jgi:hypothetical protein
MYWNILTPYRVSKTCGSVLTHTNIYEKSVYYKQTRNIEAIGCIIVISDSILCTQNIYNQVVFVFAIQIG